MDSYDLLQGLRTEMVKTTFDVKAESQLAMAMERGLSIDDFFVSCDGIFFREYSKDVLQTEIRDDASKLAFLQLHLTRCGVYDHLPEGLFFQPGQVPSGVNSPAQMAFDHRLNRQKELEIRRFFLPFENDFFLQRVQLEAEETRLLEGLRSGILNSYFIDFWGIPRSMPKAFIAPLLLLLPYAHRITGDLPYTARCLELLLKEKVEVEKVTASVTSAQAFNVQELGGQQLGIDLVCGDRFWEDYPVLVFTIGPLQNSRVQDYLEDGERFTLLQTFYRFFLPVDADVRTEIEVPSENRGMQLNGPNENVLGYSSFL